MTIPNPPKPARKTLGLTGVTINAMALVAPGALAWSLYQAQFAGEEAGLAGIWPGVLLALLVALLTAFSFGELASRYPEAGFRSAYHFAEAVFREKKQASGGKNRLIKFATGWSAHLYYWVYPGVMVAFMGILFDYLLRQFGYTPTPFGQVILAGAFAAFIGFLALRGITGTTTSSIILNSIQLITLIGFSVLAIFYRVLNPDMWRPGEWTYPDIQSVLLPSSLGGLIFQAALAMMLMVGFEAATVIGASANNPRRDVPRATVLALIIQGVFAYLLVYLATAVGLNRGIDVTGSSAPMGDLAIQVGNALLLDNGFVLMLVFAFAVMVALFGAMLTATNNGVRISFSMSLDADVPDLLGALHPKYATPYFSVVIISVVSAVIGSVGILGGLPALMGIILAANIGAFMLYAILCLLTVTAFTGSERFNWLRHGVLPVTGIIANVGMAALAIYFGISTGGVAQQASLVALGMLGLWLLLNLVYFFFRKK